MFEDHVIHIANGKLTGPTTRDHVRNIVQNALDNSGDAGIVIHMHGGLVSRANGLGIARSLLPMYSATGAYPIFLIWGSGFLETIFNNIPEVAKEGFFRLAWQRIYGMVRRKRAQEGGARGIGTLPVLDLSEADRDIVAALDTEDASKLPESDAAGPGEMEELTALERQNLEAELNLDGKLKSEVETIANGLLTPAEIAQGDGDRGAGFVQGSKSTLMDSEALNRYIDRPDPDSRGLLSYAKIAKAFVAVGARTIKRISGGRDHGLHATIVEEILREFYVAAAGKLVWSTMKKDTADSFGSDPQVHGGTALLRDIRDLIGSGAWPRVTLVGHSTGAVYICRFLEAADIEWPSGHACDIVFLAPAATCELMGATLDAHAKRVGRFRMFTMTDNKERNDTLVPVVYPRSLLYFVSGVVENDADTPLVGMQRFHDPIQFADTDHPQIAEVRKYLAAEADRAVWSIANGPPGLRSAAAKHGDFDNETQTLQSVQEFLSEG